MRNCRTLFLVVCLAGLASADTLNLSEEKMSCRSSPWAVVGEAGGSLVAGALSGIALGAVGFVVSGRGIESYSTAWTTIEFASVGYTAGTGLGAWSVGKLAKQRGSAAGAFIGSTAGLLVGAGVAALGASTKAYPLIGVAFAFPPAGAVIGYNVGRPKEHGARASLDFTRFGLPAVSLRRVADPEGRASSVVVVQVLNARF